MGLLIGLALLLLFGRFIGKLVFWILGGLLVIGAFMFFAHLAIWLVVIFLAIGGLSYLGSN